MSHATVMVIKGKDSKRTLEDIMAPYDENLEVAPHIHETRQEIIENTKANAARCAEEYLKSPDDKRFHDDKGELLEWVKEYLAIASNERTEDEIHKYGCRYYEPDEIDAEGNVVVRWNESAKWDWYEIGGRWSGMLRLKDGTTADEALAREIDWDAMHKLKPSDEKELKRFWRIYVEGKPRNEEELKKFNEENGFIFYKKEYYKDRYGTLEEYLKYNAAFLTHAVITKDGVWHEMGTMGWFGCSSESGEEARDWYRNFRARFIDTLEPDDEVTIVDYHI